MVYRDMNEDKDFVDRERYELNWGLGRRTTCMGIVTM